MSRPRSRARAAGAGILLATLAWGCASPPGPQGPPAAGGPLVLRGERSRIDLVGVQDGTRPVLGHFAAAEGSIDLARLAGEVTVRSGSLETGDPERDLHLRGLLLDAERHPTLRLLIEGTVDVPELPAPGRSVELRTRGLLLVRDRRIAVEVPLRLSREGEGMRAHSSGPWVLTGDELGLQPAFAALQTACGACRVAPSVAVSFDLLFEEAKN